MGSGCSTGFLELKDVMTLLQVAQARTAARASETMPRHQKLVASRLAVRRSPQCPQRWCVRLIRSVLSPGGGTRLVVPSGMRRYSASSDITYWLARRWPSTLLRSAVLVRPMLQQLEVLHI
jgi:hypothetical protein